MILRKINFGCVSNASGARGFFGEGYWFHFFLRLLGLDWGGSTFVAKTTTLWPRKGNLSLGADGITPREFFPRCIKVYPWQGVVLNAVGLSGPGAKALLEKGEWQKKSDPFFLSFMATGDYRQQRIAEMRLFVEMLQGRKSYFQAPFGLEINFSCPNVGLNTEELVGEVGEVLDIAGKLDIPLVPKFNALVAPETARAITDHSACDAIVVSNTIPFGQLPSKIYWQGTFGLKNSPLAHLKGGGLSGRPLLSVVLEWIIAARRAGIRKPIIGCGGILSRPDIILMRNAGASAVQLGSVCLLRPWRLKRMIGFANKLSVSFSFSGG